MNTQIEQAATRAAIRGYVWRWQFGVAQQADRTIRPAENVDHEIDAHFFAIALKNLRTAVEWGRNYCNGVDDGARGGPLGAALSAFDHAVPHLGDVRNVQEHFVEYEMGSEKRQLPHIPPPLAIWWESSGDTVVVNVGGYRLDVADAAKAGHELAQAAMEALADVPDS